MARPKTYGDELADRLLDEAAQMVAVQGPDALSLRRLAEAANTSTTAIYSIFGGKNQLMHSLFARVFRSFGASQQVPPSDDPAADLRALGRGYRRWAIGNPQLFSLMFDTTMQRTDVEADEIADSTRAPLLEAVARAQAAGMIDPAHDAELVAHSLWGQVHGLVSLELGGLGSDSAAAESAFDAGLAALLRGWALAGTDRRCR